MALDRAEMHPLVVMASNDGYVDVEDFPVDGPIELDPRDQAQIQPLINRETVGATDMRLSLGRMLPGMYHLRHHHSHGSEIYYFTRGSCLMHLDGEDFRATPGTAVYIPPNTVHSMRNDTDECVELVVGCSKPEYGAMGLVYDE